MWVRWPHILVFIGVYGRLYQPLSPQLKTKKKGGRYRDSPLNLSCLSAAISSLM